MAEGAQGQDREGGEAVRSGSHYPSFGGRLLFLNLILSLMICRIPKLPDNFNVAGYMNFVYLELGDMRKW